MASSSTQPSSTLRLPLRFVFSAAHSRTAKQAWLTRIFPTFQALLHAVMGVGIIGLIGKVHKWDESAMYFDGSSLGVLFLTLTRSATS